MESKFPSTISKHFYVILGGRVVCNVGVAGHEEYGQASCETLRYGTRQRPHRPGQGQVREDLSSCEERDLLSKIYKQMLAIHTID